MQRKMGRRKGARGALPFANLWSLALCYQSLACHVHFVLASMQKMKHLRRKNGHLLKLSLIESINPLPHDHNAILKALGKIELVNHHQPLWKKKKNLPLSNPLNPPSPSGGIFHDLSISGRGGSLTWPGGKKPVRASIYSLAQVF